MAQREGVELRRGGKAGDVTVQAEADRLLQVFLNLLTNAIKYNTNERPVVTISSRIENQNYDVYIEDNGQGIRDIENLFEKFSPGDNLSRRGGNGAGLGLPISRQMMLLMQGDLNLVERDTGGACFRIRLPLTN